MDDIVLYGSRISYLDQAIGNKIDAVFIRGKKIDIILRKI